MANQVNLAASLDSWSARHRIPTVVGWLLLVVVAMLAGSAAGQVTMTRAEYGSGRIRPRHMQFANAGVAQPAQELVMVHGATATACAPGLRAAVRRPAPTARQRADAGKGPLR